MRRRLLIGLIVVVALLGAAAWYLGRAPLPAPPPGDVQPRTLSVGGLARRYLVFAPPSLPAGAPALLVLHPSGSSGGAMRRMTGRSLETIAAREGVAIAYPDGWEGHFNDCRREASYSARTLNIDDVAFIRGIVTRLAAELRVDPRRVYALGYSNGGHLALRLALESPELVAGVVAIAASLPAPENMDCPVVARPTARVVFIDGTRDPVNPYAGGRVTLFGFGNRGSVLSARASAQWFADRLGLVASPPRILESISGMAAREEDWTSTAGHVRLVTIEGGGHTVPQAAYRFPRLLGPTFPSDAVLESTWRMLTEPLAS